MAGARSGTGGTIVLGGSAYDVDILSISQGDETLPVFDTSHLGTAGSRTKGVGELIDHGSVDVEIHVDPDELDALKTAMAAGAQTVTITFPTITGETNGATASGSGAVTAHNYTVPLEDKIAGGYTITWLGAVTYADST